MSDFATPHVPTFQKGARRDTVDLLEERQTTGPSMAVRKEWVKVASAQCRATELAGTQAYEMGQRGFKKPWIIIFPEKPLLSLTVNRIRVTDSRGVHEIDVKSFRDVANSGVMWVAEGDEVTTKPLVGK